MSARFQPGELVDLSIRGARVSDRHAQDKNLHLYVGDETFYLPLRLLDRANITRVAPVEWPPQPGDLWDDADGVRWVFTRHYERSSSTDKVGEAFFAVDQTEDRYHRYPRGADKMLADHGPMTLVYRKGWTPAPAADVDQADEPEVDERAAHVAGLRALADLYETTDMPLPAYGFSVSGSVSNVGGRAAAERAASVLGVEIINSVDSFGDVHWKAERKFSKVEFHLFAIERQPRDVPAPQVGATLPAPAASAEAGPVAVGSASAPDFELGPLSDEQIDGAIGELAQVLDANPELLADEPDANGCELAGKVCVNLDPDHVRKHRKAAKVASPARFPRFAPDAVLVVDMHNGPEEWTGAEWNDYVASAERNMNMVTARLIECPPPVDAGGEPS